MLNKIHAVVTFIKLECLLQLSSKGTFDHFLQSSVDCYYYCYFWVGVGGVFSFRHISSNVTRRKCHSTHFMMVFTHMIKVYYQQMSHTNW